MKTKTQSIVFTKSGKVNQNVLNAIMHCRFDSKSNRIYTGYYNGSGKWATKASSQSDIIMILQAQGYKFTKGNDAPKGGITGDFLKVSKTAFNFIQSIITL